MTRSIIDLWAVSKSIYHEIYYRGRMTSASPTKKAEILSNYKNNLRKERRRTLLNSLSYTMISVILMILPLVTINQLNSIDLSGDNIQNVIFTSGLILGVYSLQIFLITFTFLYINIFELLSGEIFDFLNTLNFDPREYSLLGTFIIMRMIYMQLIIIIIIFPLIVLIISGSFYTMIIFLIFSIIVALSSIYLTINICYSLFLRMQRDPDNPSLKTAITAGTILIYLVTVIPIFSMLAKIINWVKLMMVSTSIDITENYLLASIFFPFSPGYLVILILTKDSSLLLIISIVSFSLLVAFLALLIRRGNRIFSNLHSLSNRGVTFSEHRKYEVVITVKNPRASIITNTLNMIKRDIGSFSNLLLPVIFPVSLLAGAIIYEYSVAEYISEVVFWPYVFLLTFLPNFYGESLNFTEEKLGGLLSSLPVNQYDLFKSKQIIMTIVTQMGIIIIAIIGIPSFNEAFLISIIHLSLANILASPVYLILRSLFFGKINGYYTLQILNIRHSFKKNIIIGVINSMYLMGFIGFSNFLISMNLSEFISIPLSLTMFYLPLHYLSKLIYSAR